MRIKEAWQNGYTGKGVVITVLDDGLERDHPDLVKNFVCRAFNFINA
jgi:furin